MIGLAIYILADTIFIANAIGELGLAALNLAIPIFTLVSGIGLLIGIGGGTWYTILRAQRKPQSATNVFNHALILGGILSLICMLVGLFGSEQLSIWFGANDETLVLTSVYLRVILLFAPFFIFNNLMVAFIRNDHNPKVAMMGMLLGSLANIIFDYIFIYIFDWGMLGAALATSITPIISILVLLLHFKSAANTLKVEKIKWEFFIFGRIVNLGLSAFITELSTGIVILVFNIVIVRIMGNIGVAAYSIIANISFVVIAIYTGVAQGMQPIVSDLFGRNQGKDLKRVRRYGMFTAIALAFAIYLTVNLTSDWIISVFNRDNSPLLQSLTEQGLRLYFIGFFAAGVNMIAIAYLNAIERANLAFKLSILRGCVFIVPLIMILAYFFDMVGVWLSFGVSEFAMLGLIVWQLKRL